MWVSRLSGSSKVAIKLLIEILFISMTELNGVRIKDTVKIKQIEMTPVFYWYSRCVRGPTFMIITSDALQSADKKANKIG